MAGQTINDRIIAARHTIAGQGLAKSVCKSTTEEMIGPKKKHLDYLIHCTNEPNVSIPQLATLLIERSQSTNWVVVYKSLITCHHLMCYGNERFTQYLASSNSTFQLSNFLDKSGVQGIMAAKAGYDMSPFIRRYARYLNEKALAYRTVAFDFCKVKRGKDDSLLRTMGTERLLKTLPALQNLLDALLEFDCSANDLTNSVINVCFMLLFRDLIRLFACYNDAIINLLEKYFDMNKKQCREALDLYKKFLIRMDRVGEFLKVAENVGIDKGDIPDLTKAPSSLLDALEQHLASIEGKKGSSTTTPTQAASNAKNVKSGVHALSSTSSSFGSAVTHNDTFVNTNGSSGAFATSDIDETLRQKVLAEEEAAMNQYKSKLQSPSSITSSTINNPFLTPPGSNAASPPGMPLQQAMDLFSTPISLTNARASDDLLQLSNPFADAFAFTSQSAVTPVQAQQTNNLWVTNGFSSPQLQPPSSEFVPESSFSSVFGTSEQIGFDAFGGILKPASSQGQQLGVANTQSNATQSKNKVLTGDLESSLASLAENLSINSRTAPVKGVQWNSPKNGAKIGSSNWTPQPMAATTGAGYRPMGQGMASAPIATMQPLPFQPQMTMGIRPIATMVPATGMMTGPIGMVPQIPPLPTQMPLQAAAAAIPQQHQQQGLQFH